MQNIATERDEVVPDKKNVEGSEVSSNAANLSNGKRVSLRGKQTDAFKTAVKAGVKEEVSLPDCCLPKIKPANAKQDAAAKVKVKIEKDGVVVEAARRKMSIREAKNQSESGLGQGAFVTKTAAGVEATVSKRKCCVLTNSSDLNNQPNLIPPQVNFVNTSGIQKGHNDNLQAPQMQTQKEIEARKIAPEVGIVKREPQTAMPLNNPKAAPSQETKPPVSKANEIVNTLRTDNNLSKHKEIIRNDHDPRPWKSAVENPNIDPPRTRQILPTDRNEPNVKRDSVQKQYTEAQLNPKPAPSFEFRQQQSNFRQYIKLNDERPINLKEDIRKNIETREERSKELERYHVHLKTKLLDETRQRREVIVKSELSGSNESKLQMRVSARNPDFVPPTVSIQHLASAEHLKAPPARKNREVTFSKTEVPNYPKVDSVLRESVSLRGRYPQTSPAYIVQSQNRGPIKDSKISSSIQQKKRSVPKPAYTERRQTAKLSLRSVEAHGPISKLQRERSTSILSSLLRTKRIMLASAKRYLMEFTVRRQLISRQLKEAGNRIGLRRRVQKNKMYRATALFLRKVRLISTLNKNRLIKTNSRLSKHLMRAIKVRNSLKQKFNRGKTKSLKAELLKNNNTRRNVKQRMRNFNRGRQEFSKHSQRIRAVKDRQPINQAVSKMRKLALFKKAARVSFLLRKIRNKGDLKKYRRYFGILTLKYHALLQQFSMEELRLFLQMSSKRRRPKKKEYVYFENQENLNKSGPN